MRPPTLKSIALHVGVNVSTVSRVLNGKAREFRISKETEEAVLSAAKEFDYRPNQIAQGLRLKRTHSIGLIIPDISNPFFSTIARSIEEAARRAKYSVLLCDSQEDPELEAESIKLLHSRKVDGCILCPVGLKAKHLVKLIKRMGVPIVLVDRSSPDMNCSSVTVDNYSGALEAVSYLIRHGHTKIGCIQGLPGSSVNDSRIQGYKDAHTEHRLSIDESLIVGKGFGENEGYRGTQKLLALPERPTALYTCGNLITLGAIRAIQHSGLQISDDISLIAFDDETYFAYLSTPITAVAQPRKAIGKKAFQLLIQQIKDGNSVIQSVTLPTKTIIRKSVKMLN